MSAHSQIRQVYQTLRFSQFGEDAVLSWLFGDKRNGFYVDVGCHHPFRFSNTASLHLEHDWRGINVDVDDSAIQMFRHYRPGDVSLCCAVGAKAGRAEVTLCNEGALNTIDPSSSAKTQLTQAVREKRQVDVRTLAEILAEHLPLGGPVDFLNVDVEGLDCEVLQGNDWSRVRPGVIAVEVHDFNLADPAGSATYRFMREVGYRLISQAAVTSFYVAG